MAAAADQMAAEPAGCSSRDPFLALPRVPLSELSYERFIRQFALPRVPCIIEAVGSDWIAAKQWRSLEYFLSHPAVARDYPCTISIGRVDEHQTTVGEALTMLADRVKQAEDGGCDIAEGSEGAVYINAWDFVRGGSGALQDDFSIPKLFDRAPSWLAEHAVFGNAAVDLRWLYIGEGGTGSPTHIDPNLSSAWLWLAHGEKSWVCAHGDDCALIHEAMASGSSDCSDGSDDGTAGYDGTSLPDLFRPNLFERHPKLRQARLYRGLQRAGEIVFNPSCCVHAVRNVSPLVVSLTHNFIDATNFVDALHDATRSFHEELIPMVRTLGPKKVLKTLASSLHLKKSRIQRLLESLPRLLTEEKMHSLIEAAVEGASDEAEESSIRTLLSQHLAEGLEHEREPFEAAALELCELLFSQLSLPNR